MSHLVVKVVLSENNKEQESKRHVIEKNENEGEKIAGIERRIKVRNKMLIKITIENNSG